MKYIPAILANLAATVLMLSLAACGGFVDDRRIADRQAHIKQAKEDDRRCRERGYEFPEDAYVSCRKALLDRREERQLYRWSLIEDEPDPLPGRGPRLTTDRGDFECRERQWEDTEWIDCRVQ